MKDRFPAVASSQQMVTLLKPHYKLPKQPQALERHKNANMFLFPALLFATAGGTAATVVKKLRIPNMRGLHGYILGSGMRIRGARIAFPGKLSRHSRALPWPRTQWEELRIIIMLLKSFD